MAISVAALCACAAVPPSVPVDDSKQFAADWREHTHALFNHGWGAAAGRTAWELPPMLPRGYYRVIRRDGAAAELLDGYRVKVEGYPTSKIFIMVPIGNADLEVLDEKYIPQTNVAKAKP
jgi:hypothetical protein